MSLDLYAGIYVRDYATAKVWYDKLLGSAAVWEHLEKQAVWKLAEHRYVAIEEDGARAGCATHAVFVDDFDDVVGSVKMRGLEPAKREWYPNGVRRAVYRDPDGNELSLAGLRAN